MVEQSSVKINKSILENLKLLYGDNKSYNEILEIVVLDENYIHREYSGFSPNNEKLYTNFHKKICDIYPLNHKSKSPEEYYDIRKKMLDEMIQLYREKHPVNLV